MFKVDVILNTKGVCKRLSKKFTQNALKPMNARTTKRCREERAKENSVMVQSSGSCQLGPLAGIKI